MINTDEIRRHPKDDEFGAKSIEERLIWHSGRLFEALDEIDRLRAENSILRGLSQEGTIDRRSFSDSETTRTNLDETEVT